MANTTTSFDTVSLSQKRKELDALLVSNPAMEKEIKKIIRKMLREVRKAMMTEAKSNLKSDPRKAYRAIKTAVYRQVLGGNVSILDKLKGGAKTGSYTPPRHPSHVGGNRRKRSKTSKDIYMGESRAFVLRFINQGTNDRFINFVSDSHREEVNRGARGGTKYGKTTNTGNRGRITPRNFFGSASHKEMENAARNIAQAIDNLVKEKLK